VQDGQGGGVSEPLLVELFTEELPPKALQRLGAAFAKGLLEGLQSHGLASAKASVEAFSTPRRLAARISGVLDSAPERAESKKLMPVKVAFGEDGKPSAALRKRLDKEGAPASQLQRRSEGGAEYVFLDQTVAGISLAAGLQTALADTIAKLPVPKLMSYQLADGTTTVEFVRPAHGLIALHGDKVVDVSALGLKAGRIAHGHRFQGVKSFEIEAAGIYEDALYTHGRVIASFDLRRVETERQLRKRAGELNASLGPEREVEALLDEVTGLIEHPTVYVGEFEPAYLAVPPECLILTMRANQKYFPLFDSAGKLTNKFLIVSNMRLTDPSHIIEGNERVVRPRLADARFFFETDKKTKLEDRVPQLATVTYHNKLGSQLDRVTRVRAMAKRIANILGVDSQKADRAAELAKADLVTNMVGEFPELQGTMGMYYALNDGEDFEVARAIGEHYRPRFSGDECPNTWSGICVALADKLQTLAGIWLIGGSPSGDKDPFGLRRQAIGILRILIEHSIRIQPMDLIRVAVNLFPGNKYRKIGASGREVEDELNEFVFDRTHSYFKERGYLSDHIEACLSSLKRYPEVYLYEIEPRLETCRTFSSWAEAPALVASNKRIRNILAKSGFDTIELRNLRPDSGLFREDAEKELYKALVQVKPIAQAQVERGDFTASMKSLATLRESIDLFFDSVMVNVDNREVQTNRLSLLSELEKVFSYVADISKLAS
jgi:glycyl-tRNA synthetase beta chain